MNLYAWFQSFSVSPAEVRTEIWLLGSRHLGRPLDGALAELKRPGVEARRAVVLRACVRKLRRR